MQKLISYLVSNYGIFSKLYQRTTKWTLQANILSKIVFIQWLLFSSKYFDLKLLNDFLMSVLQLLRLSCINFNLNQNKSLGTLVITSETLLLMSNYRYKLATGCKSDQDSNSEDPDAAATTIDLDSTMITYFTCKHRFQMFPRILCYS